MIRFKLKYGGKMQVVWLKGFWWPSFRVELNNKKYGFTAISKKDIPYFYGTTVLKR